MQNDKSILSKNQCHILENNLRLCSNSTVVLWKWDCPLVLYLTFQFWSCLLAHIFHHCVPRYASTADSFVLLHFFLSIPFPFSSPNMENNQKEKRTYGKFTTNKKIFLNNIWTNYSVSATNQVLFLTFGHYHYLQIYPL